MKVHGSSHSKSSVPSDRHRVLPARLVGEKSRRSLAGESGSQEIGLARVLSCQRIGGGVVPSNPTIRITTVPNPISQRTFRSSKRTALFCCATLINGREISRYPWLQQEKIPSTEPDH